MESGDVAGRGITDAAAHTTVEARAAYRIPVAPAPTATGPVFAVLAGRPEPAEIAATLVALRVLATVAGDTGVTPAPAAARWRSTRFAGARSWRDVR
jgi:hypothetical protein